LENLQVDLESTPAVLGVTDRHPRATNSVSDTLARIRKAIRIEKNDLFEKRLRRKRRFRVRRVRLIRKRLVLRFLTFLSSALRATRAIAVALEFPVLI